MNSNLVKKGKEILSKQWVQWSFVLVLLAVVLALSTSVRLSNLDLLVDETSGEYIPLALDPYYFLRMSETYADNGGELPEFDEMRFNVAEDTVWHNEIMYKVVYHMYKIANVFNSEISLQYINVISPVIFYAIGLAVFFFLCWLLSDNKFVSLLASSFLAFTPAFLYRTMAGFSDHESIGVMAFVIALTSFILYIRKFEFKKKNNLRDGVLFGLLVGFLTTFTILSWTGVAKFLFIIFPLAFILIWFLHFNKAKFVKDEMVGSIGFYSSLVLGIFLFSFLFGYSFSYILGLFTSSSGMLMLLALVLCFVDMFLLMFKQKISFFKDKFRLLYDLFISSVLGFFGLFVLGKNPFVMVFNLVKSLVTPFGTGRIGLTVAENAQPYLVDWINNTGAVVFWLFFVGAVLFGLRLCNIKDVKKKSLFYLSYVLMVCGIVFSRISLNSVLNGDGFLSGVVYFVPLLFFFVSFVKLYLSGDLKIRSVDSLIFVLIFFTLVSGRAAARVFFAITPFVCFIAAFLLYDMFGYFKNSKDDVLKMVLGISMVVILIFSVLALNDSYNAISNTAKYTAPSANAQWQNAMSWVRNNTDESAVFAHWWDYGYWVQTLGERATVADGGHFENGFGGDHKIGRYVLTTPNPDTALSFFKSMDVDYLLIDQTDLGKYSAYSKIGSDEDWDRFSIIPTGVYSESEVQETANETVMIYPMNGVVDEDLEYDSDDDGVNDIFLPGPSYDDIGNPTYRAYMGAVVIRKSGNVILQPEAIYVYNNKQYRLPLRYVYVEGQLHDFYSGVDAVVSIVPGLVDNSINVLNGAIYLSPKVKDGLFAQLYLLDDAFSNYPTIELAYEEDDQIVSQVKIYAQGAFDDSEFIFYNGGLRGPIKVWNVEEIPEEINVVEGFYNHEHSENDYAILDDEVFRN